MRTAALDGAHVEYFRGIRNPIAVKIGPSVTPDTLMRLVDVLDPDNEPGRLTLIHRMGASKVETALPPLLTAIRSAGRKPLFVCDPMHGNTETLGNGFKTRRFQNIRDELDRAFDIHAAAGTRLGGARARTESDHTRADKSTVDTRLNKEQSLELAMLIVGKRGGVPAAN
jgi:3-deoxy-7-phosphoheptulonate synthase